MKKKGGLCTRRHYCCRQSGVEKMHQNQGEEVKPIYAQGPTNATNTTGRGKKGNE